jgi:hypothetical protein
MVAPEQEGGLQMAPCGYRRHAPAPSQAPSPPQLSLPWSGHCSRGSVPTSAGRQAPTLPCDAQDMQVAVQAALQQTPSAQKPLRHSTAALQGVPSSSPARGCSPSFGGGDASGMASAAVAGTSRATALSARRSAAVPSVPSAAAGPSRRAPASWLPSRPLGSAAVPQAVAASTMSPRTRTRTSLPRSAPPDAVYL